MRETLGVHITEPDVPSFERLFKSQELSKQYHFFWRNEKRTELVTLEPSLYDMAWYHRNIHRFEGYHHADEWPTFVSDSLLSHKTT